MVREMRHQVEIEGAAGRYRPSEQRQDMPCAPCVDEEVRILHTLADPLQRDERAEVVALQPAGELRGRNRCENGHDGEGAGVVAEVRPAGLPLRSEGLDDPHRNADLVVQRFHAVEVTVAFGIDKVVRHAVRRRHL